MNTYADFKRHYESLPTEVLLRIAGNLEDLVPEAASAMKSTLAERREEVKQLSSAARVDLYAADPEHTARVDERLDAVQPEFQSQQARSSRIRAAWNGEGTLMWAFWGFNFGGGILLAVAGAFGFLFLLPFTVNEQSALASPVFRTYLTVFVLIYLAYVVASAVMIWRCSFNTGWHGWAYAARILIVLWLLRLVLFVRTLVIG